MHIHSRRSRFKILGTPRVTTLVREQRATGKSGTRELTVAPLSAFQRTSKQRLITSTIGPKVFVGAFGNRGSRLSGFRVLKQVRAARKGDTLELPLCDGYR